mmetsp:Transcript_12635/g.25123  ORF Transcript_12635/g.25123 Transcript_12635/m.25123 type:complete len:208 (-) Transcript_12635:93-716(-)
MSTTASGCAKFWSAAVTALSKLLGTSACERWGGRKTTWRRRTRSGTSSVGIIIQAPVSRWSADASVCHLRPPPLLSLRTDSRSGRYVGNASSPSTGSVSTACTKRGGTRPRSTWLPLWLSLTSWRLATSSKSALIAKPSPAAAVTGRYAKTSSPSAERSGARSLSTGNANEIVVVAAAAPAAGFAVTRFEFVGSLLAVPPDLYLRIV